MIGASGCGNAPNTGESRERKDMATGETESEFRARLEALTDAELRQECEKFIWLSAYAANNPRAAYHWKCDCTYSECSSRKRIDIYEKAWNHVSKQG